MDELKQRRMQKALDRIKENLDALNTVEEFEARLTVSEYIYAYVVKRFALKFPEEARVWMEKGEEDEQRREAAEAPEHDAPTGSTGD